MPPIATALHQLRRPSDVFVGRDTELADVLDAVEEGCTILIFHGMGGSGKTELALQVADRLRAQYDSAQLFVDLQGLSDSPIAPIEAMRFVIESFGQTGNSSSQNEDDLRHHYLSVLDGQRALVILDNAYGVEQVQRLIPPRGSLLLVTSRERFILPGTFAKSVDELSPEAAQSLLLVIARRIDEHAARVAELCGYLPLALRLAATFIVEYPDWSVEEYLVELENDPLQHLSSGNDRVDRVLGLSVRRLAQNAPELAHRWHLLAVFPTGFDREAAQAVWEVTEPDARRDLSLLCRQSLLTYDDATGKYRMHDLLRAYALASDSISEEEWERSRLNRDFHLLRIASRAMRNFISIDKDVIGRVGARIVFRPHNASDMVSALEPYWAIEQQLQAAYDRLSGQNTIAALNMVVGFANIQRSLGREETANEIYRKALDISRAIQDVEAEIDILMDLGFNCLSFEPQEGFQYFSQASSRAREVGGLYMEGVVSMNISTMLYSIGYHVQAISGAEYALRLFEALEVPHVDQVQQLLNEWRNQS